MRIAWQITSDINNGNLKSEYFQSLSEEDKKDYLAKLTLSTKEQLPDPFILHSNLSDDVSLLPDITYPDSYHYLIEYPSVFSKESLKAYKSLESYNFLYLGMYKMFTITNLKRNASSASLRRRYKIEAC